MFRCQKLLTSKYVSICNNFMTYKQSWSIYKQVTNAPYITAFHMKQIHTSNVICSSIDPKSLPEYGKHCNEDISDAFLQKFIDSSFLQSIETSLISTHDLGLPWWATISLVTIALRSVITFPLMIYTRKNQAKMVPYYQTLTLLNADLRKELKKESIKNNWDSATEKQQFLFNVERHKRELKLKMKPPSFFKRYMVIWFQVPIWVSMSFAIRDLTLFLQRSSITTEMLNIYNQLSTEGLFWFVDLCQPDSFYILPILTCVINLAIVEIHGLSKSNFWLANISRALCVCLIPIASQLPSAVALYWFCSSSFGLIQAPLLRSSFIKKFIGNYKLKVTKMDPPLK